MTRPLSWACAGVLAAYAAVSLTVGVRHALAPGQSQDFAPVYMAARLWLHGDDPYRTHTAEDWQRAGVSEADVPTQGIERAYSTPYAPVALLVVSGIAALPWDAARLCWLVLNIVLAAYAAWLMYVCWFRAFSAPAAAMLIALWFGGIGLRVGLGNGQHALLWFAATLTMYVLMLRQRPYQAGGLLALSLHKYPLTAFVVPFLAAHGWFRLLAAAALTAGAALLLFALRLGALSGEALDSFLRESAWWYGQTGPRGLGGQGITDVQPLLAALLPDAASAMAMNGAILIGLLAVCWPVERSRPYPAAIDLAALFLLMLVAAYHRVYDTIVLIVPLAVLAGQSVGRTGWQGTGLRTLTVLLAAVWYVDPSAIYRRIAPMALDAPPETWLFGALDLGYRAVLAVAFVVMAAQRLQQQRPSRTLVLRSVES